ncbi:hypothetical protein BJX76DRAFT_327327 [Aspergillus varians]
MLGMPFYDTAAYLPAVCQCALCTLLLSSVPRKHNWLEPRRTFRNPTSQPMMTRIPVSGDGEMDWIPHLLFLPPSSPQNSSPGPNTVHPPWFDGGEIFYSCSN